MLALVMLVVAMLVLAMLVVALLVWVLSYWCWPASFDYSFRGFFSTKDVQIVVLVLLHFVVVSDEGRYSDGDADRHFALILASLICCRY